MTSVVVYYLLIIDLFVIIILSTQRFNALYNCSILTGAMHVPVGGE